MAKTTTFRQSASTRNSGVWRSQLHFFRGYSISPRVYLWQHHSWKQCILWWLRVWKSTKLGHDAKDLRSRLASFVCVCPSVVYLTKNEVFTNVVIDGWDNERAWPIAGCNPHWRTLPWTTRRCEKRHWAARSPPMCPSGDHCWSIKMHSRNDSGV